MPLRRVPTELCERTQAATNVVLADYFSRNMGLSPVNVTRSRLGLSATQVTELPAHDAIVRMVSYAEHYASTELRATVETRLTGEGPIYDAARAQITHQLDANWHSRSTRSKSWLALDLRAQASFRRLEGFVEARNAIVHGLGELTDQQLSNSRRKKTHQRLREARIPLSGRRLLIEERHVVSCAENVCAFAAWLDASIPSAKA